MESKSLIQKFRKELADNQVDQPQTFSSFCNFTRIMILLALIGFASVPEANAQQLPSPVRQSLTPEGKDVLQNRVKELTEEDITLYKIYEKAYLDQLRLSNHQKYEHITGFFREYEQLSREVKAVASKKLLYELYFTNKEKYKEKLSGYISKTSPELN